MALAAAADPEVRALRLRIDAVEHEHRLLRPTWEEVATYVLPRRDFTGTAQPGQRRDLPKLDDTAAFANFTLASTLQHMECPMTASWFTLADEREGFNVRWEERRWYEQAADWMHAIFGQPMRRFYTNLFEAKLEQTAFGTGGSFDVIDDPVRGPMFVARPLSDVRIAEDERKIVDERHVVQEWRLVDAVREWPGADWSKWKDALETSPQRTVKIVHLVFPNGQGRKGGAGRARPYRSVWLLPETDTILSQGYMDSLPGITARLARRAGEVYGVGFGVEALATVKQAQDVAKRIIQAFQLSIAPPVLIPHTGLFTPFSLEPFAVNVFDGARPGFEMPRAMTGFNGNLEAGLAYLQQLQAQINRYFQVDALTLPVTNQMTQLEVAERRDERLRVLSPVLARSAQEFLGPLIDKVFGILWKRRMLPKPPDSLLERGRPALAIEYQSPMARLQRAGEIEAIMRTIDVTMALGKIDPKAMLKLDAAAAIQAVADRNGTPVAVLRDPAMVEEMLARIAEQEQNQAEAQTAAQGAAAARDMAHAMNMAQPKQQGSAPRARGTPSPPASAPAGAAGFMGLQ